MKKKKDILIIAVLFIAINIIIKLVWVYVIPFKQDVIKNDKIHTVVVGSSTSECSLNDSILTSYLNLSQSALWFAANYGSVIWTNEYNDVKIDTVICSAGITSFLYYTPGSLAETPERIHRSELYSTLCYSDFFKTFYKNVGYIKNLFTPINYSDFIVTRIGGEFTPINRQKLHDSHSEDAIKERVAIYGRHGFSEEVIRKDASEQVYFLFKIKEYCKEHGIIFILFNSPCYNISNYIDDTGYKNLILHGLGDDQLIADYTNFVFPDDSYYGDMEHLNKKGAEFFSNHIKTHGLKLITASEYCK